MSANDSKVREMTTWPTPTNVQNVRGFLGLMGYYRRFIRGYGAMENMLTNLLKQGGFVWGFQQDKAFTDLRATLSTLLVLAMSVLF